MGSSSIPFAAANMPPLNHNSVQHVSPSVTANLNDPKGALRPQPLNAIAYMHCRKFYTQLENYRQQGGLKHIITMIKPHQKQFFEAEWERARISQPERLPPWPHFANSGNIDSDEYFRQFILVRYREQLDASTTDLICGRLQHATCFPHYISRANEHFHLLALPDAAKKVIFRNGLRKNAYDLYNALDVPANHDPNLSYQSFVDKVQEMINQNPGYTRNTDFKSNKRTDQSKGKPYNHRSSTHSGNNKRSRYTGDRQSSRNNPAPSSRSHSDYSRSRSPSQSSRGSSMHSQSSHNSRDAQSKVRFHQNNNSDQSSQGSKSSHHSQTQKRPAQKAKPTHTSKKPSKPSSNKSRS
jgi:hypothetical protein